MAAREEAVNEGRWVRIFCHEVGAKGRTCGACLGAINLDMPHRTRKYCHYKHLDGKRRMAEYRIDSEGHVKMRLIPPDARKEYFEDAVISVEPA